MDELTRIQDVMRQKGITQRALTIALGLNETAFGDWKRGDSASYKKYRYQIADILGVSVAYLKGETEERNPPAPLGTAALSGADPLGGLSEEDRAKVIEYAQMLREKNK